MFSYCKLLLVLRFSSIVAARNTESSVPYVLSRNYGTVLHITCLLNYGTGSVPSRNVRITVLRPMSRLYCSRPILYSVFIHRSSHFLTRTVRVLSLCTFTKLRYRTVSYPTVPYRHRHRRRRRECVRLPYLHIHLSSPTPLQTYKRTRTTRAHLLNYGTVQYSTVPTQTSMTATEGKRTRIPYRHIHLSSPTPLQTYKRTRTTRGYGYQVKIRDESDTRIRTHA